MPKVSKNICLDPDLFEWIMSRKESHGENVSQIVNRSVRKEKERVEEEERILREYRER
jgi:succinate dehydrogenase flavin-adding protein (antitoxin of CptAB toxin-antitoxin module)